MGSHILSLRANLMRRADKLCMWPCHLVSYILSSNVDLACVLNSIDARFGILNVHTDINDCTWGLYKHRKEVCVESWLWGKSPCCTGNWTGISSASDPVLYQLSQIPAHQGMLIWWDYCHTHTMLSIWWNSSCLDVVCWEFSISTLHINIITADEERLSFTQNFSSLYTFRGTLFNAENTSSWSKGTLFKTKDMFPCKVVLS